MWEDTLQRVPPTPHWEVRPPTPEPEQCPEAPARSKMHFSFSFTIGNRLDGQAAQKACLSVVSNHVSHSSPDIRVCWARTRPPVKPRETRLCISAPCQRKTAPSHLVVSDGRVKWLGRSLPAIGNSIDSFRILSCGIGVLFLSILGFSPRVRCGS